MFFVMVTLCSISSCMAAVTDCIDTEKNICLHSLPCTYSILRNMLNNLSTVKVLVMYSNRYSGS